MVIDPKEDIEIKGFFTISKPLADLWDNDEDWILL